MNYFFYNIKNLNQPCWCLYQEKGTKAEKWGWDDEKYKSKTHNHLASDTCKETCNQEVQ